MTPPHPDSEEALELESITLFEQLGYTTANCYNEWISGISTLGRETRGDVVLISQLRPALKKLNPTSPNKRSPSPSRKSPATEAPLLSPTPTEKFTITSKIE